MKYQYAQIDGGGVCVATLSTGQAVDAPNMIPISPGENRMGQRWTGAAWVAVAPTAAELAALELAQVDQATGMSRTLREALIAIAGKAGADVGYLAAQETKAAAARAKLSKG